MENYYNYDKVSQSNVGSITYQYFDTENKGETSSHENILLQSRLQKEITDELSLSQQKDVLDCLIKLLSNIIPADERT